jgi:hypothetical protein
VYLLLLGLLKAQTLKDEVNMTLKYEVHMSLNDHDNEADTGVSDVHMTFKDEVRMSLEGGVHTSLRRWPLPAFTQLSVNGFFFKFFSRLQGPRGDFF